MELALYPFPALDAPSHLKPVAERLEQLRALFQLTKEKFSEQVGVSRQWYAKLLKGQAPSIELLESFAAFYNIDIEWLRHGKGSLQLLNVVEEPAASYERLAGSEVEEVEVPFVRVRKRGHFLEEGAASSERMKVQPMSQREAKELAHAVVFEVDGDSMEPMLHHGDRVLCYPVTREKWELLHKMVCVVAYGQSITIKAVYENELITKGVLTLYSVNRSAFLPLHGERITNLWRVDRHCTSPKVRL